MTSLLIRVVLIHEQSALRRLLSTLLSASPQAIVVGHARNWTEALEVVAHQKPDLLFLDSSLPLRVGFDSVDELLIRHSLKGIIFIVKYADEAFVARRETTRYVYMNCLIKPIDPVMLQNAIRDFYKQWRMETSLD